MKEGRERETRRERKKEKEVKRGRQRERKGIQTGLFHVTVSRQTPEFVLPPEITHALPVFSFIAI